MKKIIEVDEVRMTGFTGMMLHGQCHHNVAYLTQRYGGKQVVGYYVEKRRNVRGNVYKAIHHSIWKTPEGKYVEVTLRDPYMYKFGFFGAISEVSFGEKFYVPPNFLQQGGSWTPYESGDPVLTFDDERNMPNKMSSKFFRMHKKAKGNSTGAEFLRNEWFVNQTNSIRENHSLAA